MKSILGVGNALVDILVNVTDDSLLSQYALPKGSMQHVSEKKSNDIFETISKLSCSKVAGGSAANTVSGTASLGLRTGFIGKTGDDELGRFFYDDQTKHGIKPLLMKGNAGTGRAMVIISNDSERTFAVYLGSSIELGPDDLHLDMFKGYDFFHIEGYLVQNHALLERAVHMAKQQNLTISLDMASYNVVAENKEFLEHILKNYVNIVFANEDEAKTFTGESPEDSLPRLANLCDIAVVKVGKDGSVVQSKHEKLIMPAGDAKPIDCTGAGDLYASGFLYGMANNMDLEYCAQAGTICAGKVIEVVGPKISETVWQQIKAELHK